MQEPQKANPMLRSISIVGGILVSGFLGLFPWETLTCLFIAYLVWPFVAAFFRLLGKALKRKPRRPEYVVRRPEPIRAAPAPLTTAQRTTSSTSCWLCAPQYSPPP